MSLKKYHLGCPMWANKAWVGELFRPETRPADFLPQYSSVFNTVEGNTTFYALPDRETVARWRRQTPADFRFCFKFPRRISHHKKLKDVGDDTRRFFERLSPLESRLGPFFLQLPPTFGPGALDTLQTFLKQLPAEFSYAVEVRHPAFFLDPDPATALDNLLTEQGVDRVLFDSRALHASGAGDAATAAAQRRKPKNPIEAVATGKNPMLRFVGDPVLENNRPLLRQWAAVAAAWIRQGLSPFIFIHAPDDFYAPRLARLFHQIVLEQDADAGELPAWPSERPGTAGDQLQLFE